MSNKEKEMEETAKQYLRNQQYYCSLIDSALEGIPAAYIANDGTTVTEPLRAKLPEIVKALRSEIEESNDAHAIVVEALNADRDRLIAQLASAEAELSAARSEASALFKALNTSPKTEMLNDVAGVVSQISNMIAALREQTRVRDARTEPPGDDVDLVLMLDGHWFSIRAIEFMGREFDDSPEPWGCVDPAPFENSPFWLPMPPKPTEEK